MVSIANPRRRMLSFLPLYALAYAVAVTVVFAQASFTRLGDLPDGRFESRATAVSADGSVVVGTGYNANSQPEAFRWTSGTGMVALGMLTNGYGSWASAVSADGA